MANADRKHIGAGAKGKKSGSGAMTDLDDEMLSANQVLDNRDRRARGEQRGRDGRNVQTEQYEDHEANRRSGDGETSRRGASSDRLKE